MDFTRYHCFRVFTQVTVTSVGCGCSTQTVTHTTVMNPGVSSWSVISPNMAMRFDPSSEDLALEFPAQVVCTHPPLYQGHILPHTPAVPITKPNEVGVGSGQLQNLAIVKEVIDVAPLLKGETVDVHKNQNETTDTMRATNALPASTSVPEPRNAHGRKTIVHVAWRGLAITTEHENARWLQLQTSIVQCS